MDKKTKKSQRQLKSQSTLAAKNTPVGVVGLGVMGAVIAAGMLAAGHPVCGVALEATERQSARRRVRKHLDALYRAGELREQPQDAIKRLKVSAEYSALASCQLVVESIIEDMQTKRKVIAQIEEVVSPKALIGSNTSALPITEIQQAAKNPKRVLGLHWASSSPFVRIIEVMGGEFTSRRSTKLASEFVRLWEKTPTHAQRDTRGFLSNRIGYAMLREAFALLDEGVATPQEIDDALRASMGTWLPFVGPFGYLDLTGPAAYAVVMRDLFPHLSCTKEVPRSLQKLIDSGGQGIGNGRGFYRYAPGEGQQKRQQFEDFRRDITALIQQYETKSKPRKRSKAKAEQLFEK